jgi:hypothetical protein
MPTMFGWHTRVSTLSHFRISPRSRNIPGPELSIYNRYIVGYYYIVYYKRLGSPASVVYGLSLCLRERSYPAGFL